MFTWAYSKFTKQQDAVQTDLPDSFSDSFGVSEVNVLVIADKKDRDLANKTVESLKALYSEGVHFVGGISTFEKKATDTSQTNETIERKQYSDGSDLETVLLNQKSSLESFDSPPILLVFDRCEMANDDVYKNILVDNKKLRFSTITVLSEVYDKVTLSLMDYIILVKDKNKTKCAIQQRIVWDNMYKDHLLFIDFEKLIHDNWGSTNTILLKKDSINILKINKNYKYCAIHKISSFKTKAV